MHRISVLGTPTIQGFERDPGNNKISGANLTTNIAITNDDTIFQPDDPVRICAWLQVAPHERPKFLSPTSGKKDDLLWTKAAADRGSLTLAFRITIGSLDKAALSETCLKGAQLKIRADLPRSMLEDPSHTNDSIVPGYPVASLHATSLSSPKDKMSSSSILETLLDRASLQTPLDVITIGINTVGIALPLASCLSLKMWKDAECRDAPPTLFEPSTIAVADEAEEMIEHRGSHGTAEAYARRQIKGNYIDRIIQGQRPNDGAQREDNELDHEAQLKYKLTQAVRLRFNNLDSDGSGDGAWALMIAADEPCLNESARELKARQIMAVAASSIWHSTDKASPKLLLSVSGPIPADQLTLLDMVKSDGWEIVEQLGQLPEELFPTAPTDSNVQFCLLESRMECCDYTEIDVSTFERKVSARAKQSVIDPELWRVGFDTANGTVAVQETMRGLFRDAQITEHPVSELYRSYLHTAQNQTFLSITTRTKRTEDQGKAVVQGAPDSKARLDPAARRRPWLAELGRHKKRLRTTSSPEQTDEPKFDASDDATAADATTDSFPAISSPTRSIQGGLSRTGEDGVILRPPLSAQPRTFSVVTERQKPQGMITGHLPS